MTDQCKNCVCRGKIDHCLKTPCIHHENWYAVRQQARIEELTDVIKAIVDAEKNNSGYEPSLSVLGMAISEAEMILNYDS